MAVLQQRKLDIELGLRTAELLPRDRVLVEGQNLVKAIAIKIRALPHQLLQAGVISAQDGRRAALVCVEILTEISSWQTIADLKRAARETPTA